MQKIESLKKAVSRYEKQSSIFKKVICSTNRTMEGNYKVAEVIVKNGKPFTDGVFVKKAFLNCAELLFNYLSNKCTVISRIKDMPIFSRTVERRITDMAIDVTQQQTVALKASNIFSVTLDESIDVNDNPRLAVLARHCSDDEVHEELCACNLSMALLKKKIFLTPLPKILRKEGLI